MALQDDVLALPARLRALGLNPEETLVELRSGYLPEPLVALTEGGRPGGTGAFNLGAVA